MDAHSHHEESFSVNTWSTDHKSIGLQYGITANIFISWLSFNDGDALAVGVSRRQSLL